MDFIVTLKAMSLEGWATLTPDMRITAWRDHAPAIEAPRQHQSLALVVEHGCIGPIPQKQQQEQPMQE